METGRIGEEVWRMKDKETADKEDGSWLEGKAVFYKVMSAMTVSSFCVHLKAGSDMGAIKFPLLHAMKLGKIECKSAERTVMTFSLYILRLHALFAPLI